MSQSMEEYNKSYRESRERIVMSVCYTESSKIREYSTGDVVSMVLTLVEELNNRSTFGDSTLFWDATTKSKILLYTSNDSLSLFFSNYTIEKGVVHGDFEIFRNGVAVDLLVPKNS